MLFKHFLLLPNTLVNLYFFESWTDPLHLPELLHQSESLAPVSLVPHLYKTNHFYNQYLFSDSCLHCNMLKLPLQRISFFYVPVNLKGQQLFCDPDPVDQILVKIDMDYSFPYLVSAESASSARYCFLNPFTLACGSSTIKYWLLYLTHTSSIRSVKRIDPPPTNTVTVVRMSIPSSKKVPNSSTK